MMNYGGDQESSGANMAGTYSFEWPEGEDYFEGVIMGDPDATNVPSTGANRVGYGSKKKGYGGADDEQT